MCMLMGSGSHFISKCDNRLTPSHLVRQFVPYPLYDAVGRAGYIATTSITFFNITYKVMGDHLRPLSWQGTPGT
jgi:hypothetical protein